MVLHGVFARSFKNCKQGLNICSHTASKRDALQVLLGRRRNRVHRERGRGPASSSGWLVPMHIM
jgi:hypothetical protein